ncbi:hypothetical protein O181_040514 [Austropuccinia psidii MF-1]|uniref:DUF866-domain-containing protein n=1 Tax=Austropuccinia psidii MF-1 TaxID=1389203 RepID=A0A9Q3HFL3_9BASI|nr:hypothetical protein [Austropuccinia psidii MF-1]
MVKFNLNFKAELNQLDNLRLSNPSSHQFFFKVKCNTCHEIHSNWVALCRDQEYPISGSRGNANFVWKCQFCKREASVSFTDVQLKAFPSYTESHSSQNKFSELCTIDCRGCEFIEFDPRGQWTCQGLDSQTEFKEIEFEDGEWHDYDEKAGLPVSITNIETKIDRA